MRKKCLLVGGCGFLLSNFVRKCLYAKDETLQFVTFDKLLYKHSIQNYYANKHHKLYIGDVCDFHQLKSIVNFEKPDIVIFGAGDKTINSIQTKLAGLDNLSKLSSQFEKLIYLSSTNVSDYNSSSEYYGPMSLEYSFEYSAEIFIREKSKLNYNILCLSNVYGPRQPLTEFIPLQISNVLKNQDVNFSENPNLLYVDDFCSALTSVIEKGEKEKRYSTGISYSNVDFLKESLLKIHQGLKDEFREEILLKSAEGDSLRERDKLCFVNPYVHFESAKALEEIGWSQQFGLLDGLQETYNWYKNNSWFGRSNETL